MSDNRRTYRAIKSALRQLYPGEPQGNLARHLDTLAAMVSGIDRSQSSQLPAIARKVPDGNKPESRVKRYSRWVKNEHIDGEVYFPPFAEPMLQGLAQNRTPSRTGTGLGARVGDGRQRSGPRLPDPDGERHLQETRFAGGVGHRQREQGPFSRSDTRAVVDRSTRFGAPRKRCRLPGGW